MSPLCWVTAYLSIEKIGVLLAHAVAGEPQIPETMSITLMGQKCIIDKVVDNQNRSKLASLQNYGIFSDNKQEMEVKFLIEFH